MNTPCKILDQMSNDSSSEKKAQDSEDTETLLNEIDIGTLTNDDDDDDDDDDDESFEICRSLIGKELKVYPSLYSHRPVNPAKTS